MSHLGADQEVNARKHEHQLTGEAASSSTVRRSPPPIEIHNSYSELAQAERAEEVANEADQEKEVQAKMQWDPARRNADLANRKQQWRVTARDQEVRQQDEDALHRPSRSGAPSSTSSEEPAGRSSKQGAGGSARLAGWPDLAGGPSPPDQPSATKGDDLGERADRLGRLAQGQGREGGPPEPSSASLATGTGLGLAGATFPGSAGQERQVGQLCPTTTQAFPGAGDPGRAAGRGIAAPD
jgi:hypothetical protein